MRQVFKMEDINLEDLMATAMQDVDLIAGGNAAFRGIKFTDLQSAYRQFCTGETHSGGRAGSGRRHRGEAATKPRPIV
jgi:hypothetical protein